MLVDRLWPRGLSKQTADLDEWCKQIAPPTTASDTATDPERFDEFARRYQNELEESERAEALRTYASWPDAER